MKLIHNYDATTKLYTEDAFIEADVAKNMGDPVTYTLPANATDIQPVGLHTPKWSGVKWIEAGDPVVIAALKKEATFVTVNKKILSDIAVLEAQQTPRLLREASQGVVFSVKKLASISTQAAALRKLLQ